MKRTTFVFITLLFIFGCASLQPHHVTWSHENVAKIKLGMIPDEVVAIFGLPDKQSVNTYGALTSNPWQGLYYEYHFYKYGDYCINTFTFNMENSTRLNSWDINCVY